LSNLCGSLSPIEFQSGWQWTTGLADTIVIGAARPSDFDQAAAAAKKLFGKYNI